MTPTLLIAAVLAQPECRASRSVLIQLAPIIISVSNKHGIPSSLLAATILAETGVRNIISYRRGRGRRGADVGYAQIHVPNWKKNRHLVKLYSLPRPNLSRAAYLFRYSQRYCKRTQHTRCELCSWFRYNPGSKTWCGKVLPIQRKIERYIHERNNT